MYNNDGFALSKPGGFGAPFKSLHIKQAICFLKLQYFVRPIMGPYLRTERSRTHCEGLTQFVAVWETFKVSLSSVVVRYQRVTFSLVDTVELISSRVRPQIASAIDAPCVTFQAILNIFLIDKTAIELSRHICGQETRPVGFGIWLEQVFSRKKI